jgi:YebC/PmpR family DNA-binding regulatory protein
MSGHSKWSKIKHQKAVLDVKKGKIFSKLSRLVTLAAKKGGDPNMNPELKDAIGQAKAINMPSDSIEKAIKKGAGELQGEKLEEIRYEAFGPGGSALIIEGITDNKNRTSSEIKHLLTKHGAKLAEPGSAIWAFEKEPNNEWQTKHTIKVSEKDKESLEKLLEMLKEHDDIQAVYTNMEHAT